MDKVAFQKAQESFLLKEKFDEINWEDIDYDESIETESVLTKSTEEENNYQIENTSESLINCVILDIVDDKIQCCSKTGSNQRPLAQLIGTWEIDDKIFTDMKSLNKLHTLGVCNSHFTFDQNILHKAHLKQKRSVEKSWVYNRRCLFCNAQKYFFSRGDNCIEHSVCIIGRNVQVPCIGLKVCSVFEDVNNDNDNKQDTIINKSNKEYRSRYICSHCFNTHGEHFFQRQGSGSKSSFSCEKEHENDTTKALEYLGQWILNVAASENKDQKKKLLIKLSSVLNIFNINQSVSSEQNLSNQSTFTLQQTPSSLFLIKTALRLGKVNFTKIMDRSNNFNLETSKLTGESLGLTIWKSRSKINEKKEAIENPSSLENYRSGFPLFLSEFFDGLIIALERKKNEIVNKKRQQRNQVEKIFDLMHAEKKSTFLISIILTIAFPGLNVWLPHIMSSLC